MGFNHHFHISFGIVQNLENEDGETNQLRRSQRQGLE